MSDMKLERESMGIEGYNEQRKRADTGKGRTGEKRAAKIK